MTIDSSLPFTRSEALAAGLTVHQLGSAQYRRIFRGVYLAATVEPTVLQRARAALKVAPAGAFISHHTAAALLTGWSPATTEVHVSVPAPLTRSVRRGIRAHRARSDAPPQTFRGLWLSRPVDVFVDLAAAGTDLVGLVVLGDALIRTKRVHLQDLVDRANQCTGRGARVARRAGRLVREGVDSPTESRLRMLVVLSGLPEPDVNVVLRTERGEWVYRLDLCYRHLKLIIEYDGRQHVTDTQQWTSDIRRREALEAEGWRIIVITAEALYRDPAETLDRIRRALEDRGSSRLPHRVDPEWARHFAWSGAVA